MIATDTTEKFSFCHVKMMKQKTFITNLWGSVGDITNEMLKQTTDIHLVIRTQIINTSTDNKCYPDDIRLDEVILVFKKKDDLDEENYRPVSVLSHVLKVLKKTMYQQIQDFMKEKLSNSMNRISKNSQQSALFNVNT